MHPTGDGGGDHQGYEGADRELEEEQLDGEHDRGEGRTEGGGHAGGGTGGEEALALRRRHADQLSDQGAIDPP
jgi:hypothetical protein